jgi:hypothetical protein
VAKISAERERLGVPLEPAHLDAGRRGERAGRAKELGGEIEPDDVAAGAGRRDRCVAGSAGDVEHVLAGADLGVGDAALADLGDELRDRGVVTAGPRPPGLALEVEEVIHRALVLRHSLGVHCNICS